jgi:hypothetical protein
MVRGKNVEFGGSLAISIPISDVRQPRRLYGRIRIAIPGATPPMQGLTAYARNYTRNISRAPAVCGVFLLRGKCPTTYSMQQRNAKVIVVTGTARSPVLERGLAVVTRRMQICAPPSGLETGQFSRAITSGQRLLFREHLLEVVHLIQYWSREPSVLWWRTCRVEFRDDVTKCHGHRAAAV